MSDDNKITVIVNRYGVNVFDEHNTHAGGITRERMERGPEAVGEAVVCILKGLTLDVQVEQEQG